MTKRVKISKEPQALTPAERATAIALSQRREMLLAEAQAALDGLDQALADLSQNVARRLGWPVKPPRGVYAIQLRPDGAVICWNAGKEKAGEGAGDEG